MIKISVQTGGPVTYYGIDEGYRKIREWGFDAVDANIDQLMTGKEIRENSFSDLFVKGGDDFMDLFTPYAEAAKKYGIDNYQAHAPFPSYIYPENADSDFNARMIEVLKNMIRGCDKIGCRNLIIHPFFAGYDHLLRPEEEWELNIESYGKLIPAAKEYGVTVNLENMFTSHKGKIYAACCSDIALSCKYVDELNALAGEKCFGFCLDTGHLLLCGIDVKNAMLTLGSRITAFHMHDNNGIADEHIAPFSGILDWDRFVDGLREIGYDRTISFETFNVWRRGRIEVMDETMKLIAKTGRAFAEAAAK